MEVSSPVHLSFHPHMEQVIQVEFGGVHQILANWTISGKGLSCPASVCGVVSGDSKKSA